jgi:bifunctional non-homologous end joining protein LigD
MSPKGTVASGGSGGSADRGRRSPSLRGRPATQVEIQGRRLRLSNLDKVLYPEAGFTKAEVVDYYARIGVVMVPHLADRAVTLVRWPDGVDHQSFFEKRCPSHAPSWLRSAVVSEDLNQCVLDDLPSLLWAANMAALELHTPQARVSSLDRPDSMVFDLDPGPGATVLDCCRVGLDLRGVLAELGLESVVKTSGSKGLHMAVPLHTDVTDDDTKDFARALGQVLAKREPERVTVIMRKDERPGKVFVDWSQNDEHKTTVCAYSLRGQPRPLVSTPVSWDEVSDALDAKDPDALTFEAPDVLERVEQTGDLYAPNVELEQELPSLGSQRARGS